MAFYLVKAKPISDRLPELRERLDSGEVQAMRPFGRALHHSLLNARMLSEEMAIWEEEDYCNPPLAQERAAVLDTYFEDLTVETVSRDQGWAQLDDLPSLWSGDRPIES